MTKPYLSLGLSYYYMDCFAMPLFTYILFFLIGNGLCQVSANEKMNYIARRIAVADGPLQTPSPYLPNPINFFHNAAVDTISQTLAKRKAACVRHHTTTSATTTKANLSCGWKGPDPDRGDGQAACVCNGRTLPLLTNTAATNVYQSCDYTSMPGPTVTNPISIPSTTWTSNCRVCTDIGGAEIYTSTCTTQPGCKPTPTATVEVRLSNNSILAGDVMGVDQGATYRKTAYSALQQKCSDGANKCDSTTAAALKNIPILEGGLGEMEEILFTVQQSAYSSSENRDKMMAAVAVAWFNATKCQEETYKTGITVSRTTTIHIPALILSPRQKREASPCVDCDPPPVHEAHTTICVGPDEIGMLSEIFGEQ